MELFLTNQPLNVKLFVVHRQQKTLLQLRKIEERALTTISSNICVVCFCYYI